MQLFKRRITFVFQLRFLKITIIKLVCLGFLSKNVKIIINCRNEIVSG